MNCNDIDRILVSEQQIAQRVREMGEQITRDYQGQKLLVVCVLKGAFVFMSDLVREIALPMRTGFMQASSYGGGTVSSGRLTVSLDLDVANLSEYSVIIVEDILDSGNTLSYLKRLIETHGAKSVKLCVLLDKPSRRQADISPDYTGFTVDDLFVVGYGLDYNERYRNLPYVGVLRPEIYE